MELDEKAVISLACENIELGTKLLREVLANAPSHEGEIWSAVTQCENCVEELQSRFEIKQTD